MIDIIAVKNRMLEIAVHGNLVPHYSDDKPMQDILANIREKRNEKIKSGQTKQPKEKPMSTDEIFDIPDSWTWVALGDLCLLISRGKSPQYSDVPKYPVFAQKCNQPHQLALEKALFLDEKTLAKWPEYFRLQDEDIVINSTGTGTMGRVGYYDSTKLPKKYPFMVPDSHISLLRLGEGIVAKYIYYALRSPSIQKLMFKQFRGSTNQREYYIDSVYATPVPIPCTAEQKAIADKLDQIYGVLDIIDAAQEQYAADAESLKAKLITLGIQGRLTEQLESDGTAEELYQQIQAEKQRLIKEGKIKKEKPLPEIKPEEVPFEIPGNWKWVRAGNVFVIGTGVTPLKSEKKYYNEGNIPWVTSTLTTNRYISETQTYITEYALNTLNLKLYPVHTLIIAMYGEGKTRGQISELLIPATTNQACAALVSVIYNKETIDYMCYFFQYFYESLRALAHGGNQPNLNLQKIKEVCIPLPPLAEQKRIAETLERVLGVLA